MRDHAIVSPRFWTGETGRFIRSCGADAQRVALYLLTCPNANMIGMYYLPLPTLCHEVGISSEGASEALARLSEGAFASYDTDFEVVFVTQMARFQVGSSLKPKDKRIMAVQKQLDGHRKTKFYKEFLRIYGKAYHLKNNVENQGPSKALRSQEQEQEQEQEQDTSFAVEKSSQEEKPNSERAGANFQWPSKRLEVAWGNWRQSIVDEGKHVNETALETTLYKLMQFGERRAVAHLLYWIDQRRYTPKWDSGFEAYLPSEESGHSKPKRTFEPKLKNLLKETANVG